MHRFTINNFYLFDTERRVTMKKAINLTDVSPSDWLSLVGYLVSVFSVILTTELNLLLKVGFGGLGFIGLLIFAFKLFGTNQIICKSETDVNSKMRQLIKTDGKVCVMSRDLSWVDPNIEKEMIEKKSDLTIFAEKRNELTEKLASFGCNIFYYGNLSFEPKTRFTIVRSNKGSAQVAIANTETSVNTEKNYKHTIYQTTLKGSPQDEWITSLTQDLIKICELACKSKEGDNNETQ